MPPNIGKKKQMAGLLFEREVSKKGVNNDNYIRTRSKTTLRPTVCGAISILGHAGLVANVQQVRVVFQYRWVKIL